MVATLWGTGKAAFAKNTKSGQLLYSGWWAALLALAVALFFGVSTVAAAVMLFVAAAVLLAPRVTESSLTRADTARCWRAASRRSRRCSRCCRW